MEHRTIGQRQSEIYVAAFSLYVEGAENRFIRRHVACHRQSGSDPAAGRIVESFRLHVQRQR